MIKHWTQRKRIKELWKEGYSAQELCTMYHTTWRHIAPILKGIKRPDRI